MVKKILSKIYGVPFIIKEYWPYYHADFRLKMEEKGLEIEDPHAMLRKAQDLAFYGIKNMSLFMKLPI